MGKIIKKTMKTQTLREKAIARVWKSINEYKTQSTIESIADDILSLIQQEVRECIPKKALFSCATLKELKENPGIGIGRFQGWNACLSDIQTKLKEKGLI